MKWLRTRNWKRIGKLFGVYLLLCLPFAWLESRFWLDEPRSVGGILKRGFSMAVLFTIIFEVFTTGNTTSRPPVKHPHES